MKEFRGYCEVCGETEIRHPMSRLCGACYNALWYWQGKTPTQMMERVRKLKKFEKRMALLLGDSNITPLRAAKRRA